MLPNDLYKAGELSPGVYEPTEAFKSIKEYACVCRKDTMELIAVCGPAHDVESQMAADLFANAADMRDCLIAILNLQADPRYQQVHGSTVMMYQPMQDAIAVLEKIGVGQQPQMRITAIDATPAQYLMGLLEEARKLGIRQCTELNDGFIKTARAQGYEQGRADGLETAQGV